ncbi:DUF2142 domain-containing protein [Leifsonia sp. NCR5]|uniref:DUF2142 domain-containing protein n=1 Tax=Leifsonia sp. NCR5 TaxID=1978342 RepID=UPI000A18B1F4|nr:DUF2142 domain-containing protein [Leifsonia sp. NCR5]
MRFPLRLFAAVFCTLFVLLTAWSLATPIYAVPDEASHTVRATTAVRGQIVGDGKYFDAPAYLYIPGAGGCFAGQPSVTPACVGSSDAAPGETRRSISTAYTNSPVYYLVVGLPSLVFSGEAAIHAMRIFSGAVVAALLAVLAALVRTWPGARWSLLLPVGALTPMVFFLGGAINPNAVEAASAAALLVSLLTIARHRPTGWRLWLSGVTAVVSAALVTGGRSLGMLWLLLVAVSVVLAMRKVDWEYLLRRASTWVVLALLAVVGAGQLFWFTRPENQVKAQLEPTPGSLFTVAQTMMENTFSYWKQMIGLFGTVDVWAPDAVIVIWFGVLSLIVLVPVVLGRGRERWIALGFVGALLVIPVVIQVALWRQVGDVWQGRYMLAIVLVLAIWGGMALDRAEVGVGSRNTVAALRAAAVVLAVGQLAAFAFTLRRYAAGSTSWTAAFFSPTWQPPGGVVPLTLAVVLALAFFTVGTFRALPHLLKIEPGVVHATRR